MPVSPTPIDVLPPNPDPDSAEAVFDTESYNFVGALPVFRTQVNALGANVYANAVEAANSASLAAQQVTAATGQVTLATAQAAAAAASANTAAAVANAVVWVSGSTYAIGDYRYSPLTQYTYRRKTVGAGAIDPSLDTTNWGVVVASLPPVPVAGAILLLNNSGSSVNVNGYPYQKTGVLTPKTNYPGYPTVYNMTVPTGYSAQPVVVSPSGYGQKQLAIMGGVAVLAQGGNGIRYSSDGVTWSANIAGPAAAAYAVTSGAGLFVSHGNNGSNYASVYTSPTGAVWTARAMPSSSDWVVSDYANGLFIAVSRVNSSTITAKSADGVTWASGGATPAHTGNWRTPVWNGAKWVMAEDGGAGSVAYSADGVTWAGGTPITTTLAVVTNGAAVLQFSNAGTNKYRYTLDGVTWVDGTLPVAALWAPQPCELTP